jgi:hypothetical protein
VDQVNPSRSPSTGRARSRSVTSQHLQTEAKRNRYPAAPRPFRQATGFWPNRCAPAQALQLDLHLGRAEPIAGNSQNVSTAERDRGTANLHKQCISLRTLQNAT